MFSHNIAIIGNSAMENSINNIIPCKPPKYLEYESFIKRLESYSLREWPIGLRQTHNSLAEAGFFYLGISDKVTCYHGSGGLCRWEQEDEPWIEHARNFSNCIYLRMKKKQEFIDHSQIIYLSTNTIELPLKMTLHRKELKRNQVWKTTSQIVFG